MPVDKFGRMSDTKTRDTGVSLTYINNNYVRSDGSTPVTGSINMNDNTLFNLPDPENPKDVATKEYADKISSLLNASIIKLTQLYIILSSTQDENKEEIKKTQEEIKKAQEEVKKTQKKFDAYLSEGNGRDEFYKLVDEIYKTNLLNYYREFKEIELTTKKKKHILLWYMQTIRDV